MKDLFILFIFIFVSLCAYGQELEVSSGRIIRVENFPSFYIPPRNIDIWLPEHYSQNKKYKVLYMHDGQKLFNTNQLQSFKEWRIDETLDSLMNHSVIDDCIVVGISMISSHREAEYFPEKALTYISSKHRKRFISDQLPTGPSADAYLKFIIHELKPYIDKNFSVLTSPENTTMAGSEAAALISLYAICEYPEVFHSVACISPTWYINTNERISKALLKYLKKHIPDPAVHRFYFSHDTSIPDHNRNKILKKLNQIFTKKKYPAHNFQIIEKSNSPVTKNDLNNKIIEPVLFLLTRSEMQK